LFFPVFAADLLRRPFRAVQSGEKRTGRTTKTGAVSILLVRQALSHDASRETADLKKQKPGIKLLDGVLQIVPDDNHNLLRRLRNGVEALVAVAAADPKFG
jgi:hypothetical protein